MGKVLLVTGGSRGIGAATALAAADDGWTVVVNYRSAKSEADAVIAAIRAKGGEAVAIAADVSRETDVCRMFSFCFDRFGRVDGLVNNAGILSRAATIKDIDLDRWKDVFAVNVVGTFLCSREAVRLMSLSAGGSGGAIVNLSSMAAVLGGAGEFVDYAASKGAVDSMTIGLAREVGAEGIRVNAVRPGLIATDIHGSSGNPSRVGYLATTVPLGRSGSAEEVSEAIVWLLSDAASYVTGAILPVSGGR